MNALMRRLLAVFLLTISCQSSAEIIVPSLPRNQPTTVNVTTSFDPETHLYKYQYVLGNAANNTAAAEALVVTFEPGVDVITNVQSPKGWMGHYYENLGKVSWYAVEDFAEKIPDPDGNITVSDYAVAPGGQLSGFSFESFSPPGTGSIITQTFAPLPQAGSEDDPDTVNLDPSGYQLEENGYRIQATVPIPDADWDGNRRPTVDGFLVFGNLKDKDVFSGSVLVVIRFAVGGEVVQMDTFKARLNNADVTRQFTYDATYKGYVARFVPNMGVLVNGRNVLLTSIAGTIPGIIDKPALDTDRVSFEFSP